MGKTMTKQDWLLLVLALTNGALLSPVQLQKSLFLFKHRLPASDLPQDFYEFEPYNYGPFCQDIYTDAELLQIEGLVSIDEGPNNIRQYSTTTEGSLKADSLSETISPAVRKRTVEIVKWVRAQSFRGLVSAIYREYPTFMSNSIFKG